MKLIKKTAEYSVLQRNDERYAVKADNGKMINGEEKTAILVKEKLITVSKPNPNPAKEEAEATEEAAAE